MRTVPILIFDRKTAVRYEGGSGGLGSDRRASHSGSDSKGRDFHVTFGLNLIQYVQKSPSPRISCMRCNPLCLRCRPSRDLGVDGCQTWPAFLGFTDLSQIGHELWLQGVCQPASRGGQIFPEQGRAEKYRRSSYPGSDRQLPSSGLYSLDDAGSGQ
jgi:hypothetical protein